MDDPTIYDENNQFKEWADTQNNDLDYNNRFGLIKYNNLQIHINPDTDPRTLRACILDQNSEGYNSLKR